MATIAERLHLDALREAANRTIEFLRRRSRDYQLTFASPAGQEVLIDLAKFCRANETTFRTDAREHAVLEGRREVWLRIANHLRLTPTQLYALYTGSQYGIDAPQEDEDV